MAEIDSWKKGEKRKSDASVLYGSGSIFRVVEVEEGGEKDLHLLLLGRRRRRRRNIFSMLMLAWLFGAGITG